MKWTSFLAVAVVLMATASLRAQVQVIDPDWLNFDSLVFIPLTSVNSTADDYGPVMIDGVLYLNSDRNKDGDEAALTNNQNIYQAVRVNDVWSIPEKGYFYNTDDQTAVVGTRGTDLYLYKTFGEGDIYLSAKNIKGNWDPPEHAKPPINSPAHEQSVVCSNGLLIISSDRPGGLGEHDIYWSRISFFGNIGDLQPFAYNSSTDEVDVTLSPDGETLYFSSDRTGNYDIYASTYENGTWQEPIRLPEPINSPFNDGGFYDCDSLFFMNTDREGNDDIYEGYTYPQKITVRLLIAYLISNTASKDTMIVINKQIIGNDTVFTTSDTALTVKNIFITANQDTTTVAMADTSIMIQLDRFDQMEHYMDTAGGIKEYYARVQIGAYYGYSVQEFKSSHPSLKSTSIIIENVKTAKGGIIQKFLIGEKFATLEKAEACQREMVEKHRIKDAFVAVYSLEGERIAIFNTYTGEFILLSGDKKPKIF